ncbi:GAF domain-containing protein [Paenibacillus oryzisoli]|uniref:GAF domain-containing protein n=1 Tax=Paenibacillus oryzisoli TaxID=1850517 RepID=A0A198AM38_9BACL|nr:GAF domain-containing protein [Paenibacillus oryzisoli]OAS22081.1 hypothetical protein A8708_33450 [Paenibacillus oryzisoli]
MATDDATLVVKLEQLRRLTSCDFMALAPLAEHASRNRWKYVIGNSNNRYQQMVIQKGQGLAGSVLRLGRWVKLDDTHPKHEQERLHCPLMLAEQLQAAAVFPLVPIASSQIKGLLFIGKREHRRFEHDELLAVQYNVDTLASDLFMIEAMEAHE